MAKIDTIITKDGTKIYFKDWGNESEGAHGVSAGATSDWNGAP